MCVCELHCEAFVMWGRSREKREERVDWEIWKRGMWKEEGSESPLKCGVARRETDRTQRQNKDKRWTGRWDVAWPLRLSARLIAKETERTEAMANGLCLLDGKWLWPHFSENMNKKEKSESMAVLSLLVSDGEEGRLRERDISSFLTTCLIFMSYLASTVYLASFVCSIPQSTSPRTKITTAIQPK